MSLNFKIESVLESELGFVLALNQKSLPAVSSTDLNRLSYFQKISPYFKIIKLNSKPIGFLIGLNPREDYSSENYKWVDQRYHSFIYVDRIVIDEKHRNKGIGSIFYDHLANLFNGRIKYIICEVNIIPENRESMNFHKKYGFKEVGQKDTENGVKKVAYMLCELSQ